MDEILEGHGIEIEEYSTGGALTGQELFPFIIVAILPGISSGFLSQMGRDLWISVKEQICKRVTNIERKTGFSFSPSGRKVSSVFFPIKNGDITIIYYVHTEKGKVELDFDNEQLKEAESEIVLLNQAGKMNGLLLGIDLKNLGRGGYLWPFDEIPSRLNKDHYSLLADLEDTAVNKTRFGIHLQVAIWFKEIGRPDIAIKHCEIAAKIAPRELAPCLLLVQIHNNLGNADRCLQELNKAAILDKKNPDIHYLMADIYACTKDLKNVIKELEIAVKLGFVDIDAVMNEPNFKPFLSEPKIEALITKMKSRSSPQISLDIF